LNYSLFETKRLTCRWRINRKEEARRRGEEDTHQTGRCGEGRRRHNR
jgi:hypothetical protein